MFVAPGLFVSVHSLEDPSSFLSIHILVDPSSFLSIHMSRLTNYSSKGSKSPFPGLHWHTGTLTPTQTSFNTVSSTQGQWLLGSSILCVNRFSYISKMPEIKNLGAEEMT